MEDFLDPNEADTLLTDLTDGIMNFPLSVSHGDLKFSLYESELEDCALKQQIEFLKTKTQKAMESVFDISSKVFKVEIKRISTSCDHIPYKSWSDVNNNGPRPVIAILSLGTPRPLNLKKGARATHKVPLYSGSLCRLVGHSSLEYTLSVPRGEGSTGHEQLLLFFVGSPNGSTDRESDCSTVSSYQTKMLPQAHVSHPLIQKTVRTIQEEK